MRFLKSYIFFLESSEFEVKLTDEIDIKSSKEKLNSLIKYISDFKSKKITIDNYYKNIIDDVELEKKVKDLIGPEISNKQDRNPFIVEYLNVSEMKRRLEKIKKDLVDDKIKLDDFNEELNMSSDSDQKSSINQKISDIRDRMSLSSTSISKLTSDISKSEKDLNLKMSKQEKEMKEYIKKVTDKKVI